ncbi:MAG: ABC1 kinase family protein [Sandaracinaceae bacterium]
MSGSTEVGRLKRAARLSRLGAKAALQQGRSWIQRDPAKAQAALARTLVEELGQLKGMPMKIGQILSYMGGVVPDEYAALYQEILGELRTQSPPMDEATWRAVFEDSMSSTPEALFDSFEVTPLASASIGQVHAARFEGQPVCVKIQYPGIAEATESDMANIEGVVGLMRRIMPGVDTRAMVDDFRARLFEECDYRHEAASQARFRALYEDDPDLLVPAVFAAASGDRVITTARINGISMEVFLHDASQEERNRAGRALFRFAFGTLLTEGLFHADPHPGNLLFRADADGRLGVLDYGCVQPLPLGARRDIAALLEAAMAGDDLEEPARKALGIDEMDPATAEVVTRIVGLVLAPIRTEFFRFSRAFASDISRVVVEAKMKLGPRLLTRRGRFRVSRDGVMFVVRNLFGLAALWGALETEGDFQALTRDMIGSMES